MSFYDREMIAYHNSLSSGTSHRSTRRRLSSNTEIEDIKDENVMAIDGNKRERTPKVSSRSNATRQSHVSTVTLTQLQMERMNRKDEMLNRIQERQELLERNAGQLVTSIAQMVEQLSAEQSRHKREITLHEEDVVETRRQNQAMAEMQNKQTAHLKEQHEALRHHRKESRCSVDQLGRCFQTQGSQL